MRLQAVLSPHTHSLLCVCVCLCVTFSVSTCVQVDLHPSGKVMMVVQYFLEGGDTGNGKQYIFFFPVFSNLQKFSLHYFFYYFCPVLVSLVCLCVMFH